MQAAQIAAVSDCLCYIEPAHDLIMSEESQNGHKKGQHTMTACLTGTGEIPFITPPPSLSNSLSACSMLVSINYVLFSHSCAYWSQTLGHRLQLDTPNLGVTRATVSV